MYYIKQTYPNSNNIPSEIYFKTWLNNFYIDEKNTNWFISGDIYIYSNSFLPNYSFSLNINTHLFELTNIKLIWNKFVYSEKDVSNKPLYNVSLYKFKTNINLINSYIYKESISNEEIFFNFSYSFNQSIFSDFKIECNEDTRRNFINQIDYENIQKQFLYSNNFELNDDFGVIKHDSFNDDSISFFIPNFFNVERPINNLIYMNKKDNMPLVIKKIKLIIDYKVIGNDNNYNFVLEKSNMANISNLFSISINDSLCLDHNSNEIIKVQEGHFKGLFFTKQIIGNIKVSFEYNYKNKNRKVYFIRQVKSFNDFIESLKNSIFIKNYDEKIENYWEVKHGF